MHALFLILAFFLSAAPEPANLTIHLKNIRSDKGQVFCAVYGSPNGFMDITKASGKEHTAAKAPEVSLSFAGLAPGRYAVSCYHDENDNGKFDRNFLGIPKEGFAFSRDAKGSMGPPKFEQAAFDFDGHALTVDLHLAY